MSSVKYFAYGSNMAADAMSGSAADAQLLGTACLPGHRLAFTRRSVRTHSGVADIVSSPGDEVWGALYLVGEDELARLDRKEGAGRAYQRIPVRVRLAPGGDEHEAMAYAVIRPDADHVPPSAEYLDGLIAAACKLALPAAYIMKLRSLRG